MLLARSKRIAMTDEKAGRARRARAIANGRRPVTEARTDVTVRNAGR